ncbi:uncharacterized protein LOC128127991 [Lactuca sativa]|uniref:uncharacterized protein LOC128127991 n=1 Tax=Lactuca sativa TaxID=4236 RepID=UPI0022AF18AB|nr:uncharacterized protein LOC128127991 [Lactuca sativa]
MTYHMNKEEDTLSKYQGLLKTVESGLKGKNVVSTPTTNSPVLAIGQGKGKKRKSPSKSCKGKSLDGSSSSGTKGGSTTLSTVPKEAKCFYCHEKGTGSKATLNTCRMSRMGRLKPPMQGLKRSQDVEYGKINLIMGNRKVSPITKIGVYSLLLSSGLEIDLNNCCYSSDMERNIISFHGFYKQGYSFSFDNKIGAINAFYNGVFYFKALPCNGVYETVNVVDNLENNVLHIDFSNDLDKESL